MAIKPLLLMNRYFKKFFTRNAIMLYILVLLTVSIAFNRYMLKWYWMVFGLVEVIGFFYFGNQLSKRWMNLKERVFVRRLLLTAIGIRMVYVVFSYYFYIFMTGTPFEFSAGDSTFYHSVAVQGAQYLRDHYYNIFSYIPAMQTIISAGISDSGYATYLGIVYSLTGDSMLISRLIKAIISGYTCVLMYKLAYRNFGYDVARLTGIMCMLMPNLIYYCGIQLKETEMVFLIVLFLERADNLMRQQKFMFGPTFFVVLVGLSLFTFRTVLGGVAFIAFFMALVMSSSRIVSWGRRTIVGGLAVVFIALMFSTRIEEEIRQITDTDVVAQQQGNMNWRSTRGQEKGTNNVFAKYAGATVFAPMIFTLPFPTTVETPGQENQKLIHGGNFVKNITSSFTIIALVLLLIPYNYKRSLIEGEWRKHILPMAYLIGYLMVLTLSSFAHSERFHLPSVPIALMFAAYGVTYFPKKYKWLYWLWLGIIFVADVGWAWFKLRGRSMI